MAKAAIPYIFISPPKILFNGGGGGGVVFGGWITGGFSLRFQRTPERMAQKRMLLNISKVF